MFRTDLQRVIWWTPNGLLQRLIRLLCRMLPDS